MVLSQTEITNSEECYNCAFTDNKICRSQSNKVKKYCCNMLDFSENCGGSEESQCSDRITDDSENSGQEAHLLFCEDHLNECSDKKYLAYSDFTSFLAERSFPENKACILEIRDLEEKSAALELENLRVSNLHAYIYLERNDDPSFEYQGRIDQASIDKIKIASDSPRSVHVIVISHNSANSLQLYYKITVPSHLFREIMIGIGIVVGSILFLFIFVCCRLQWDKYEKRKNEEIIDSCRLRNREAFESRNQQNIGQDSESHPSADVQVTLSTNQPKYNSKINQEEEKESSLAYPVVEFSPMNAHKRPLLVNINEKSSSSPFYQLYEEIENPPNSSILSQPGNRNNLT